MTKIFSSYYDPAQEENFFDSGWFWSWQNKIYDFALTYYTGLATPLAIKGGKLAEIWTDFNRALIEHGKIVLVEFGSRWLLAKISQGKKNMLGEWVDLKLVFLHEENEREFEPAPGSYVIFYWNSRGTGFSLSNFHQELCQIWKTKYLIAWDQEKSKKRLAIQFQREPDAEELKRIRKNVDSGYVVAISPDKMTNEIKDFKWLETRNNSERQQLWNDENALWNKMCLFLGIRHNPFAKEERQNNPEINAGQSFFDSWENERLEKLINGLLELQRKPWGKEVEVLIQYGDLPPCLIKQAQFQNFQNPDEAWASLNPKTDELSKINQAVQNAD